VPTVVPPKPAESSAAGNAQLALLPTTAPVTQLRPASGLYGRGWIGLSTLADALALTLASVLAGHAWQAQLLMGVVVMGELARRKLYSPRSVRAGLLDTARSTLIAVSIGAVVSLAACAAAHDQNATDAVLRTWLAASVTVTTARLGLAFWRRRAYAHGVAGRRTLIVGAGAIGAQLEQRMLDSPSFGIIPVGYLDSDPPSNIRRTAPVLGSSDMLESIVAETGIDYVVVAFSNAPDSEVLPLLRRCERLGLELAVVPRLFENVNARQRVEHVGGLPLLAMTTPHPRSWEYAAKHTIDRVLAATMLVILSPLLVATAVAVKLTSRGPVFFRQGRVGRDGRAFDILKFRSMRLGESKPDKMTERRLRASGSAPGGVEGSDRRTPIGTFLRRTSIDELPQLLNVLRGQMSLVGPRPERSEFVDLFVNDHLRYDDRHRVKSGMTGWAQVHGLRGQTSLADRVEWDNWYIQNWTLWLDLKILLLTPIEIARSRAESSC
jgi:exopolysaccharide biosynthesis polyprenyl glycosylphosphotransferase